MLSLITILIPTHKRHAYLCRILDYYSDIPVKIMVADSSDEPYNKIIPLNTEYFHFPGKSYFYKIYTVLNKITTPFVVMCADDDFIVPESIEKCIQFLNDNPDYYSVQGHYINFYNKRFVRYRPFQLTYIIGLDINSETATERIIQLFEKYMFLHYSVHRKENLLKTFELLVDLPDVFSGANQYFLDFICIINGKHKVLPVFYSARETLLYSSANSTPSLGTLEEDPSFSEDVKLFYLKIATHLSEKDYISIERAENIIRETYSQYSKRISNYSTIPQLLHKPLGNSIFSKMFNGIPGSSVIKKNYSQIVIKGFTYKRYIMEKYNTENLNYTRNYPGFPHSDEESRKQWERIKIFIKKHGLI